MNNAIHRMAMPVLALFSLPCIAHHGVTPHYDVDRPVVLEGVISRFDFINPHAFVYIDTEDATGIEQTWTCELASSSVLARNGLTKQTFKVGERIRLEGVAARTNPTGCAFRVAHFADGSVLRSTTLFGPTPPDSTPADPNSIVGTWTMKRFSVSKYEGALTTAGEAAREAFDPITDDPAIYCEPGSPVRFWVNVNEPFEIRRDDDKVVIEHRFMDTQRVVHLAPDPASRDIQPSPMGYSTGHFEGTALIAATDHFTAASLEPRYGVMHTQDLQLAERLEVNPETGDLEITWVIDDPAYFKEPFMQKELFVRSSRDPEPYDCKPGYQQ